MCQMVEAKMVFQETPSGEFLLPFLRLSSNQVSKLTFGLFNTFGEMRFQTFLAHRHSRNMWLQSSPYPHFLQVSEIVMPSLRHALLDKILSCLRSQRKTMIRCGNLSFQSHFHSISLVLLVNLLSRIME